MFLENSLMYSYVDLYRGCLKGLNIGAQNFFEYFNEATILSESPDEHDAFLSNIAMAGQQLLERITRTYGKPSYNISSVMIGGESVPVEKIAYKDKDFCTLLHFKKSKPFNQEKLLMLAPLAGHYSTLMKEAVAAMLPHYDVYLTDWKNAKHIPVSKGFFNLDNYIEYVIEFMQDLSPELNVMAVCQPTVPAFAAVALMSDGLTHESYIPKAMALMGGPLDTRCSPTGVEVFASERSQLWIAANLITRVPMPYRGFMRRVYPGYLNLMGFMSMNQRKHVSEHLKFFYNLVTEDTKAVDVHKDFYNEFLATLDMPAEFYLQTVRAVFKDCDLPNGRMTYKDYFVKPQAIKKTAIFAVEGVKDDITGVGQTKAALDMASSLPNDMKRYLLQDGVGHYGLFNGGKFRQHIVPQLVDFFSSTVE